MKNSIGVGSLIVGLFLLVHLSSFQAGPAKPSTTTIQAITGFFHNQLTAFAEQTAVYLAAGEAYVAGEISQEDLQEVHLATRLAFKRGSFLMEYNDRYAIKKEINGAPLPAVEPAVPEVSIIEPSGLQVLDEIVFEEEIDTDALLQKLTKLNKAVKKVSLYQSGIVLEHRKILEACRLELIRIFTLGLTGFDTPGSLNAIPEAIASLESLEFALQQYIPFLEKESPALAPQLLVALEETLDDLRRAEDFDSFNRLSFYRDHLQDLHHTVWEVQKQLGVETLSEVSNIEHPLTLEEAALFDQNFFNDNYFRGFLTDDLLAEKIELGRLLFYDPVLSSNNERACASCHNSDKAFTDARPKSLAIDGESHIQRNAPTLLNSIYTERFFYDLREEQLERQIKHVVLDANEFSTDFLKIAEKLEQSEEYEQRFLAAYPLAKISKYSISNALAAYLSTLTSFDSPFDQYIRGETAEIDPAVERGFNLFMGKAACGTCHFAPTFSGLVPPYFQESESEVLGVPIAPESDQIDPDQGRMASTRPRDEAPFYQHSFKTTTVRNIALTAPYMHNGAYPDLKSVLDFYNKGGGVGSGIDLPYQTLAPDPLNLTDQEIDDLIAFMESLTDTSKAGSPPTELPVFAGQPELNQRPIGGAY
ncbi:MAG: cytochrome c peroxidase [Bacteroidota bacterium]